MDYYNKYIKYYNKIFSQNGGGYTYFIENIKNISDNILEKLDKNQSDCWKIIKNKNSSSIRKKYNYDVMYIIENNQIILSTFINVYKQHKYVYLNSVCSSTEHRGQGLFKKAINYMIEYYKKLGFSSIKLNAENNKRSGLNQKKRIEIFHNVGFEIDPEFEQWDNHNNYIIKPTISLLNNGEIVEFISDYNVKTYGVKNNEYNITFDQVDKCYKKYNKLIEFGCPMILKLD